MTDRLPHLRRADARENRDRVVEAARVLFAAEGLKVPMREIARRAEVGPATLYRHFPTKQDLLAEAFAEEVRACRALVDEGLAHQDPWRGFCFVIERICELHARNEGFTEAFLSSIADAADLAAGRAHVLRAVAELAERAKRTGYLRGDFVVDDLILVFMANKGIRGASTAARVAASRRFAALVVQAFRASPTHSPLPPLTPRR